jgi:NitT/TauT family transport system permease protein
MAIFMPRTSHAAFLEARHSRRQMGPRARVADRQIAIAGWVVEIASCMSPDPARGCQPLVRFHAAGLWHHAGFPVPRFLFPVLTGLVILAAWWIACLADAFPTGTVPSPDEVAVAFVDELRSWRLVEDVIASLYRVAWGYVTAVVAAVPLGLVIGRSLATRDALMPWINFFRNLSPIAWIPFAIVWFGVGDPPAIFIIFLATFFQIVLATSAAAASVPKVYYRVAEDMALTGNEILFKITLPAILPQLVTALRVAIGVAWMVVVAAEMIAVRSGLGFLIVDARNGLRMDLVVMGMIVIGALGIGLDALFSRLAKIPAVRWGFER